MLKNYLVTAIRYLYKSRLTALINVLGLAVGMTACILILHYVSFEKSFDRFYPDGDRIYRLRYERMSENGEGVRFASCAPPAAARIRGEYPEVEQVGRLFRYQAGVSFGDTKFLEDQMYFAEQELLEVLPLEFIAGDGNNGIREPNCAYISESAASKYFGKRDPLGQTFSIDRKTDYLVTGVFRDLPANSHLSCNILLSFKNLEVIYGPDVMEAWGHTGFYTYLKLRPGFTAETLAPKLAELVEREFGEALRHYDLTMTLPLQPLCDIHLNSHYMQELKVNGSAEAVRFLVVIAVFILLMAWVNFINLSTAHALTRAREVGLRKVIGASRGQLITQFFIETILINLLAIAVMIGFLELLTPLFNRLTHLPAFYSVWSNSWLIPLTGLFFSGGVLISGLYPVLALSSFEPRQVLTGKLLHARSGLTLRKLLIGFQFILALALLLSTLAVTRQTRFMRQQDPGFDLNQILVIKAPRAIGEDYANQLQAFKKRLLQEAAVARSCVVTEVPGKQLLWDAGGIFRVGEDSNNSKNYQIVGIDYDYLDVFSINLVAGRSFAVEHPADAENLLLNETAVTWMGFSDPQAAIGQQVNYWDQIFTIVGIVKDYHQQSLKAKFEPTLFRLMPQGRGNRAHLAVKMSGSANSLIVSRIQALYDNFFPGNPFDFFFLDDYYDQQYQADRQFGAVIGLFSFLAIFVTSLGVLGLSSFMALQRTKEIGIRKVLGASVPRILYLMTRDFLVILTVAFAIVLPVAWWGVNTWLRGFAIRMDLVPGLFILPLIIVLIVIVLAVGLLSFRAATTNPVRSLRYE
ncbi:MAG: ABC transporter permease [Candidatus Neomarinimicrobiota bacterium]